MTLLFYFLDFMVDLHLKINLFENYWVI